MSIVTISFFNQRYCEYFATQPFISSDPFNLVLETKCWNSIGLNDCPQDPWDNLDTAGMHPIGFVTKNEPRRFLADHILSKNDDPEIICYEEDGSYKDNSTEFCFKNIINSTLEVSSLEDLLDADALDWIIYPVGDYVERLAERETTYVYRVGTPVFQLTNPEGDIYTMQSYSLEMNPDVTIEDLPYINDQLFSMPEDWIYSSTILDKELRLSSNGKAIILMDELGNTYQRNEPVAIKNELIEGGAISNYLRIATDR